MNVDGYPVILSGGRSNLREPISQEGINALRASVPGDLCYILEGLYKAGNGFKENTYDEDSMISIWPCEKAIETLIESSIAIGDYFLDSDNVIIQLDKLNFPIVMQHTGLGISPSAKLFFTKFIS